MKGMLVVAALFLSFSLNESTQAAGCYINPQGGGATASNKPNNDGQSVQSSNHNSALYAWSHGNTWVLQNTFHDPNANSRSATGEDYVESYSTPSGSSTGDSSVDASLCNPTELPTVRVIAPFYGGSSQYVVVTDKGPSNGSGGGNFMRIFRKPNGFKGNKQADQNIKCSNSDEATRMLAARDVISTTTNPYDRRGIYNIKYGPGTSQMWSVTEPLMTTLGLIPAGPCNGP